MNTHNTTKVRVGNFAVDSGQVMVIDPCYVWDDDFMPNGDPTGGPYDAACRITLSKKNYGQIEGGFVTSTLHGDGEYPIYAEVNEHGHIVRMVIDFDPYDSEDDEDEYSCDDCGDSVADGEGHYVNGNRVCASCADEADEDDEDES